MNFSQWQEIVCSARLRYKHYFWSFKNYETFNENGQKELSNEQEKSAFNITAITRDNVDVAYQLDTCFLNWT